MDSRVRFDVGGQTYTIPRDLLENGPPSRLQDMLRTSKTGSIILDRPVEMFSAILAVYQTGQLHIPMTSCPGAFLNELEFWNISVETLSTCCFNRLQCFLNEEETLKQFRESLVGQTHPESMQNSSSCIQTVRCKLWNIVEFRKQSVSARIYFILTLLMVLLSIFILAVKTDSSFKRAMTNCERLEYMISSGMEDVELVRETLEMYCNEESLPNQPVVKLLRARNSEDEVDDDYKYLYFTKTSMDKKSDENDNHNVQSVNHGSSNSTDNLFQPLPMKKGKFVKVPNMKVTIYTLGVLEAVTIVFFSADVALRLVSCPSLKQYFLCIINITDALALVCSYVHILVLHICKEERYRDRWIDILEYSQMLRSLRLFRIVSNIRAGKVLAFSVRANFKDLSIIALFLIAGMCTFASFFYIAENKTDVSSVLVGWYWAVITMTTVGYGDISPKTLTGRLVACLCASSGVLLFALILPIFANQFLTLYQHSDTSSAFKKHQGSQSTENSELQVTLKSKVGKEKESRSVTV